MIELSKDEVIKLKKTARWRTSTENELIDPLNMCLKDLGYSREDSYSLGYQYCEIVFSRKILDLLGISYL